MKPTSKLTSFLLPLLMSGVAASPSLAGTIVVETSVPASASAQPQSAAINTATFCSYDTSDRDINFFGPATFITLFEIQGNSTFRYEQPINTTRTRVRLPSTPISSSAVSSTAFSGTRFPDTTVSRTTVLGTTPSSTTIPRELTFFNTSVERAQQRLANNPEEYAQLLGLPRNSAIVRRGFGAVRPQFTCRPYRETPPVSIFQVSPNRTLSDLGRLSANSITSVVSRLPVNDPVFVERASAASFPRVSTTLSTLPDGNYRVTTASSLNQAGNESSLVSASPMFTFRKQDNVVTGIFEYPDEGTNACVTGTLQGNTVSGQAYTRSGGTFVISETYLGPSLALRLGNASGGDRYDNAILDLNGFARINAGTTAPPVSCG
ncbi:MAG: hypothetical protein AAFY72_01495 [Cyanobacteria bacterium J06649_4]